MDTDRYTYTFIFLVKAHRSSQVSSWRQFWYSWGTTESEWVWHYTQLIVNGQYSITTRKNWQNKTWHQLPSGKESWLLTLWRLKATLRTSCCQTLASRRKWSESTKPLQTSSRQARWLYQATQISRLQQKHTEARALVRNIGNCLMSMMQWTRS